MAIADSHNNPNSTTSQFYINTANNTNIKHIRNKSKAWGYCVFGKVVKGIDVVNTTENLPTITKERYHNVPANPVIIESAIVENDNQQSNSATSGNNGKSDISN